MSKQLSLLADPTEVAFLEFHHANPNVYTRLVKMARDWKVQGHTKAGINMLFEVLRWEHGMTTRDKSGFKLNNNYAPHYARLIMGNNEDLVGFFELRKLRGDEQAA